MFEAKVQSIVLLSPTIKQFLLKLDDPRKEFQFRAGMFLDLYLPSEITSIVTGFSICNSPEDYQRDDLLELAIKRTDYPPTAFMFDRCELNEKIFVKSGGEFFYQSNFTTSDESIFLICAGIGANPIVSILRHLQNLYDEHRTNAFPHRIAFFYTAATKDDLVFRRLINSSCQKLIKDNVLRTHYFLTKQINNDDDDDDQNEFIYRRIHQDDLSRTIEWLEKPVTTYLCGPSTFIHSIEQTLRKFHVKNIFYEKWW